MAPCEMTTALGPYLLGAVELDEWSNIDRHLQCCEACQTEVVKLAGLPGLIGRVPLDDDLASPALPQASPTGQNSPRLARPSGQRRALRTALAAVAVAVLAGLGVNAWERGPGSSWSRTFALAGANRTTHVSGGASLTSETWGTEIWLQLRGVPSGQTCEVLVRGRDGRSVVGGTWTSDTVRGGWIPATAPFQPSQIARIEVVSPPEHLVTLTGVVRAGARPSQMRPSPSSPAPVSQ